MSLIMNLNEAIKTLKTAGYLVEFLQVIDPKIVIKAIAKEIEKSTGQKCTYETDYHSDDYDEDVSYIVICVGLFKNDELKEELLENILNSIGEKFNFNCNYSVLDASAAKIAVSIASLSPEAKPNKYKHAVSNRLFIHNSPVKPEVITRTGLRCKASKYYGEARLYLMSLEGETPEQLSKTIKNMPLPEADGFYPYGENKYLVVLPKQVKVRHDREDPSGEWCFIVENVPPQNLMYISNDTKVDDIIAFIENKYKQFNIENKLYYN